MTYQVLEDNAEYQLVLPEGEIEVGRSPIFKRMLAYLIDLFFAFMIFVVPFITVFSLFSGIVSTDFLAIEQFIYENYYIIASMEISVDFILLFYFGLSEGLLGYTIGKRMLNLKVGNVTYGQAFLRNITKAFFLTMPFITLADVIWAFLNPERRRLTEIISRTKVLYEPKLEVDYRWQKEF